MGIMAPHALRISPTCSWSIPRSHGMWSRARSPRSTTSVVTRRAGWSCSRMGLSRSEAERRRGRRWPKDFATCATTTTAGWAVSRLVICLRSTTDYCSARRAKWQSRPPNIAGGMAIASTWCCAATIRVWTLRRLRNSCDSGDWRRRQSALAESANKTFSTARISSNYELVRVRLTLDTEIDLAILTRKARAVDGPFAGRAQGALQEGSNVDRPRSHGSAAGQSISPPEQALAAQARWVGRARPGRLCIGRMRNLELVSRYHCRRRRRIFGPRQVAFDQDREARRRPDLPAHSIQGLERQPDRLSDGAHSGDDGRHRGDADVRGDPVRSAVRGPCRGQVRHDGHLG